MRLWKKAPIGSSVYKYYMATPAEIKRLNGGEYVAGICDFDLKRIIIADDGAPEAFAGTVFHETSHAAVYESHIETSLAAKFKGWNEVLAEEFVKSMEAVWTPALVALGWRVRKPRKL